MTQDKTGGPAFAHGNPEQGGHPGMTLHDAAALAAIQGLCVVYWSQGGLDAADIAVTADQIADAFIAARNGGQDT